MCLSITHNTFFVDKPLCEFLILAHAILLYLSVKAVVCAVRGHTSDRKNGGQQRS